MTWARTEEGQLINLDRVTRISADSSHPRSVLLYMGSDRFIFCTVAKEHSDFLQGYISMALAEAITERKAIVNCYEIKEEAQRAFLKTEYPQ